jgi:hypothetical protein
VLEDVFQLGDALGLIDQFCGLELIEPLWEVEVII